MPLPSILVSDEGTCPTTFDSMKPVIFRLSSPCLAPDNGLLKEVVACAVSLGDKWKTDASRTTAGRCHRKLSEEGAKQFCELCDKVLGSWIGWGVWLNLGWAAGSWNP